jgi:dCTP deaminase
MLSRQEIQSALNATNPSEQLIVTPLLDSSQVGPASIDLRLGFHFLLSRRANIPYFDPIEEDVESRLPKYQEGLTLSRGSNFYLHPGEFVLGASLEYLRMPLNLGGYVTSRSSWGRVGLVIATATAVGPGFLGVITLELANVGTAPLILRPGVRIAQIVLHTSGPSDGYAGRYRCPTFPEAGKIHLDPELAFWRRPTPG